MLNEMVLKYNNGYVAKDGGEGCEDVVMYRPSQLYMVCAKLATRNREPRSWVCARRSGIRQLVTYWGACWPSTPWDAYRMADRSQWEG
jgi:hypothetical protein